ncbi:MAG TPA: TfoX/Sxy family protein [Pirellulaceae bacterium]|nr:TfoX/Sxy family protein [Pirellulaceae bacterium]
MAVSETFRSLVLDQLARVAPAVTGKRMFGGLGIYSREMFFALADQDRLYLKADDQTRGEFKAQGWEPFRPFGDDRMTMQYYEVPLEVIENVERLRPWVERALDAAARGAKSKRKSAKRTKGNAGVSSNGRKSKPVRNSKRVNRGSRGRRG